MFLLVNKNNETFVLDVYKNGMDIYHFYKWNMGGSPIASGKKKVLEILNYESNEMDLQLVKGCYRFKSKPNNIKALLESIK